MNKRFYGSIALYNKDGELMVEVPANHHEYYYRSIMRAMAISAQKNFDYCGGDESDSDPLGNFKESQLSGIDPAIALWVRMTDKIGRIKTWFKKGELRVEGEGIQDALMDLGNYCFLMLALLREVEDGPSASPKNPVWEDPNHE